MACVCCLGYAEMSVGVEAVYSKEEFVCDWNEDGVP